VPALAGIPVTHRDFSSTVTVITGHESDDKEKEVIDWRSLAAVGGTLVILMGMSGLERNAKRLVENGLDPLTPAAVIEKGATSEQRVVLGVVSNIAEKCRKENVKAPAIMVIGEVVLLGERLGDLR
jgi:siroheme synthase